MVDANNVKAIELQSVRKRKNRENGLNAMRKRVLSIGYHNQRLQVLPVHWDFSKMTFLQLCYNWKTMNRNEKVPPLCMLNKGHVSHLKKGWEKLRMMVTIM